MPTAGSAGIRIQAAGGLFVCRRQYPRLGCLAMYGSPVPQTFLRLWCRRNVTGSANEVGTIFGHDDLEAVRDAMNGWRVVAICLREAGHASPSALWASQLLVPFIGHSSNMNLGSTIFQLCKINSGCRNGPEHKMPPT
jgi:hypothetical protein